MIHIGIDTSNYKTSVAAVDDENRILVNLSEYLDVPEGERGLRQSEAFFKHSNRLPDFIEKLAGMVEMSDVASVGASYAPRRVEDSYMPCFLAGLNLAKVLSTLLKVPCYEFSHQEGHAAAIIETCGISINEPVIFMHLSGGTTEFLKCIPSDNAYDMEIVGGSLDISFGQLIDRFGVAAGLSFPAGMEIDRIASECNYEPQERVLPDIRLKDGYFNLSGPETILLKFASSCSKKELRSLSFEIMDSIASVISDASGYLHDKYGTDKIIMAGGVASSSSIRRILKEKNINDKYTVIFGDAALSGDNAVGTAILAGKSYRNKQR